MELIYALSAIIAFAVSFLAIRKLIEWERKSGFVSKDMHKEDKREVAHTAGPGVIAGVLSGILVLVAYMSFFGNGLDLTGVFAGTIALLIISYIGLIDDLFILEQYWKPILPILAAIPLMAINVGNPNITIPFIGTLNVGLTYPLLLIPLGIIVASNVTNMLAGFNGLEAGMGIVIFATLSIAGAITNNEEMLAFSLPMLGALLAFYSFNKYPAKIFPGDSTNYLIGAAAAVAVIVGNFESIGAILLLPYGVDAVLKAINKFPKTFVELKGGKLIAPAKPRGLIDVVLNIKSMDEKSLARTFIAIEAIISVVALVVTLGVF